MAYTTASGVKLYLNSVSYSTEDWPSDSEIEFLIDLNDSIIDRMAGKTYATASGVEYYDCNGYEKLITDHAPIITITELAELQDDGTYAAMTETRDDDVSSSYYVENYDAGIIHLNDPISDNNAYRLTYTWGYSTTPAWVSKLSLLLTVRDVLQRLASSNDSQELMREIENQIKMINIEIDKLGQLIDMEFLCHARGL